MVINESERRNEIESLYEAGLTLEEIDRAVGVTKQRVDQLLRTYANP